MNRRKLLSRREEYLKAIEDSPEQERSSSHFYSLLRSYYKRKWGVNLQLPRVNGVEVNLYKLYTAVKTLGGWCRVTNTDKWYDVARDVLGLGDETTSADYCARLLYMRYLAKYEQFEQGSDTDDHDSEMMGSRNRGRGYSLYVTSECPIPYPKREQSDDQLQYERIIKSLASGLPNEVDFALNTCAIMSAPGPFVFNLDRHSALINLIISQAAVFDDNSDILQEDFLRTQKRTTKRDFGHFWSNAGIQDEDLLKIFSLVKPSKYSKLDYELFPFLKDEGHDQKKVEIVEYRVHQVLDIVRNLAFDTHNQPFLANNWACLKFLVICAATEINELRTNALDALSELAPQICLSTDTLTTVLLRLLRSFIFSDDRILVMRSAEVIGGLCVNTENESVMSEFLEVDILKRLFEIISAKDVLICVNTLDTLYNISEAGRAFCERLASVPHGIELLVNFCTIEASQFTTNGLYGIKVTDRHNGNDHAPMRPSTSYYHAQHPMQSRTLPPPLQPLPMSAIQNRPHVVVSSKGDIAAVGNSKQPMLAAQLARPVIPVMQSGQEVLKRETSVLNGSQVKQIRIVNGNGEPVIVQQATTSLIESSQTTVIKAETQESVVSNNTIKEDTTMDETIEDDGEGKMEIDESADQSTSNADITQDDQQIESIVEVETTIIEEKTELIIDVPTEESTIAPKSSSTNSSESADVVNDETENEKKPAKKTVPNGANHSDEHPILNGVNKEDNHKLPNNNGTAENEVSEENEDVVENGPVLNGTPSNKHIKENGCINSKKNNEEEKPLLNGSIKSKKSKAKKRPVEADSNGSPSLKKTKKSPPAKKKAQKNGYIEPKESETEAPSTPTATQTVYVRVPNFMCEWEACTKYFHNGSSMIYHILHDHIEGKEESDSNVNNKAATTSNPSTSNNDMHICRWPGCERTPRSRWSLITHLQENHCNDNALNAALRKRREMGDFNYIANIKQRLQEITPPIHHPGYTKFAAYDAIRRHAFNYMSRDITEDHQEGPVTKDLRLTSALILRNLAKNSSECRKRLRPHEGFISYMAMSRLENSAVLAQCLAALNPVDM